MKPLPKVFTVSQFVTIRRWEYGMIGVEDDRNPSESLSFSSLLKKGKMHEPIGY